MGLELLCGQIPRLQYCINGLLKFQWVPLFLYIHIPFWKNLYARK